VTLGGPVVGREGSCDVTCEAETSMVPLVILERVLAAAQRLAEPTDVDAATLLHHRAAIADARAVVDLPAEHVGTCFFTGQVDGVWVGSRFEWECPACGTEHSLEVSPWD
jgi:hypothetical protein